MAKASASSANPLTLIGDFTNPLGIAATVVVIALVLGCAGQLIQLLTPKKTKKKSGGAATRASARASSSSARKAAAPASAAKKASSAKKATPKSAAKKSTASAASLVSPTRVSTRTRTPAKKYTA